MVPNPFIGIVWKAGLSASWLATALVVVAISPLAANAGALNDTGQTLCYGGASMVTCSTAVVGDAGALPRQDGRFGRDAAIAVGILTKAGGSALNGGVANGFDFSKIANDGTALAAAAVQGANPTGWGCTKDNVTELTWKVVAEAATDWNTATAATYAPVQVANNAGLCGHTDWRVPTRRELLSIVDYGRKSPTIDPTYFPATANDYYWAKESYQSNSANAWSVNFTNGNTGTYNKSSSSYPVRLVRGGQPSSSFTVSNGIVSDSATGLMWGQCSRGLSGNGCATGTASTFTWTEALADVVTANNQNYLGYNDWRLPNSKELESLAKLDVPNPSIDATFFPNTSLAWYWSNTTYAPGPTTGAWVFYSGGGGITGNNKGNLYRVRLVRDGQLFSSFDVLSPPNLSLSLSGIGIDHAVFSTTSDINATGYWMLLTGGSAAPSVNDVLTGAYSGVGTLVDSGGSVNLVSNNPATLTLTGLNAGTNYTLYYVADNRGSLSALLFNNFTTSVIGGPLGSTLFDEQTRAEVSSDARSWQSMRGIFVPPRMLSGQDGAVFVFARLSASVTFAPETTWFLDSGGNWHLYVDCRVTPAFYTGTLRVLDYMPIFPTLLDFTPYAGSELYIGHGLGGYGEPSGAACNDMFVRQSWVKVYTQP